MPVRLALSLKVKRGEEQSLLPPCLLRHRRLNESGTVSHRRSEVFEFEPRLAGIRRAYGNLGGRQVHPGAFAILVSSLDRIPCRASEIVCYRNGKGPR